MKKQMIFSDLDGTLLKDNHKYSLKTKRVVKKTQDAGIPFVITTGRLFNNAMTHAKKLRVPKYGGYFISNNGACVYSFKDNKILLEKTIPQSEVNDLFNYCVAQNLKIHLFSRGSTFVNEVGKDSSFWSKIMKTNYYVIKTAEEINEGITHVTIIHRGDLNDEQSNQWMKTMTEQFPDIGFKKFNNRVLEATEHNVSKGSALAFLSDLLKVEVANTVSFGDSFNDYDLITTAGTGVAVANAVPQLKALANEISDSNQKHGPAKYIETRVLKRAMSVIPQEK